MSNRAIILTSRPHGEPRLDNFKLVQLPLPEVREGQVLLQTLWLSLDPYMRGIMDDRESYSSGVNLGEPMWAGVVSRVLESMQKVWNVRLRPSWACSGERISERPWSGWQSELDPRDE